MAPAETVATPLEKVIAEVDPKSIAAPDEFVTVGDVPPDVALAPENTRFFEPVYAVAVFP